MREFPFENILTMSRSAFTRVFFLRGLTLLVCRVSKGTAAANNISATPTFLFFRNKVRVDQYQGADASGLEDKIKQHVENDPGSNEDSDIPKGYVSAVEIILITKLFFILWGFFFSSSFQ